MWDGLFKEYELESRFQNLDFKLKMMQKNTKFFLEVYDKRNGKRIIWCAPFIFSLKEPCSLETRVIC
jgi:hypothetical protein